LRERLHLGLNMYCHYGWGDGTTKITHMLARGRGVISINELAA
jgi:hypothetical protein